MNLILEPDMKYFIIWFCNEGLENIMDFSLEDQSEDMAAMMEDEEHASLEKRISQYMNYMTLRAKYNSQRFYECWSTSSKELSKEDLTQFFEDSPQAAANLIREKGMHLYGEGEREHQSVIR